VGRSLEGYVVGLSVGSVVHGQCAQKVPYRGGAAKVPLGHIVQPVDPAKGAIEAVHGLQ
jgi:hypothetical protein